MGIGDEWWNQSGAKATAAAEVIITLGIMLHLGAGRNRVISGNWSSTRPRLSALGSRRDWIKA